MKKLVSDVMITAIIFGIFVAVLLLSNYLHYGQFLF